MERFVEKFIRYLEIEKNYSTHTILNYRLDLEEFQEFLGDAAGRESRLSGRAQISGYH